MMFIVPLILGIAAGSSVELAPLHFATETLEIIAMGDVGEPESGLEMTAKMINEKFGSTASTAFLLGDNFYPAGVEDVEDPMFEEIFVNLIAKSLPEVKFHVILGNHDYKGDPEAQIEYSKLNAKWVMPSKYYRRDFVSDSAVTCVWFLDTQLLRGEDPEQLSWLDSTLAASSHCNWKIVTGHHGIYSAGKYADDVALVRDLLPVLEQHGVDLYLSGHDHQSRVFRREGSVKTFIFITAGASADVFYCKKRHNHQVWCDADFNAFVHLSIKRAELTYSFIESETGKTLFTETIQSSLP